MGHVGKAVSGLKVSIIKFRYNVKLSRKAWPKKHIALVIESQGRLGALFEALTKMEKETGHQDWVGEVVGQAEIIREKP